MRNIVLSFFITFIVALSGCTYFEDRIELPPNEEQYVKNIVVSVGVETSYPPFSYTKDGEFIGISRDYLDLISAKTGLQFRFVYSGNLCDVLDVMKSGDTDIITSVAPTAERLDFMSFTIPYLKVPTVMLVNGLPITYPLDVAYSDQYAIHTILKSLDNQVHLIPFGNDEQGFKALLNGQVDAQALDEISAKYLEKKYNKDYIESPINFEYDLSFGVQKTEPVLLNILNRGISAITPEEHSRIQKKKRDSIKLSQPFSTLCAKLSSLMNSTE